MLPHVLLLVFFVIVVLVFSCAAFESYSGNDKAVGLVTLAVMMIFSFITGMIVMDWNWTCFVVDHNLFEWSVDDKGWSFIRMVK